jgi:hypothetical protein
MPMVLKLFVQVYTSGASLHDAMGRGTKRLRRRPKRSFLDVAESSRRQRVMRRNRRQ